jgi:hypothetical protein
MNENGSKARSRNNSERNLQQCPAARSEGRSSCSLALQLLDRSKDWTAAADASRLFLCGCCVVASARGRWAVDDGAAVVLDRCTRARAGYYRRLPPYMLSERDGAAPYVLYVHPGSGYGGWLVRSPVK